MQNLVKDFKVFALSGNVVDLAIGVILGTAFGVVVDKFANDVLLSTIAALFQAPSPDNLSIHIRDSEVYYGAFLGALINFLMIAFVLLMLVKLLIKVGMNFRAQGNRECDFCKEFVPVDATRCRACTSELEPLVTD